MNKLLKSIPSLGIGYQGQDKLVSMSMTNEQYAFIRKQAEKLGYARNGRSGGSISAFCKILILKALEFKG